MKPWASRRTKTHSQVRIVIRYRFESKWRGWDFGHTNRRCYMAAKFIFRISRWPCHFLLNIILHNDVFSDFPKIFYQFCEKRLSEDWTNVSEHLRKLPKIYEIAEDCRGLLSTCKEDPKVIDHLISVQQKIYRNYITHKRIKMKSSHLRSFWVIIFFTKIPLS